MKQSTPDGNNMNNNINSNINIDLQKLQLSSIGYSVIQRAISILDSELPIDDCRMETDDCDTVAVRNREKQKWKNSTDKDAHKAVLKSRTEMREKDKENFQREEMSEEEQERHNSDEQHNRMEGERERAKQARWSPIVGANTDVGPNHRERTSQNNRFHALTAIGAPHEYQIGLLTG